MPESTPEPLRTNEPEPAPPAADRAPKTVTCKFCGCVLTRDGDYITLSDQARGLRDQKEEFVKERNQLNEQISDLQKQIVAKNAEIATLKGSGTAPKKVPFL